MRNFIIVKLEQAKNSLDLSGVVFEDNELYDLIEAINNKPAIATLILENSAISSRQAGILAQLTHVVSLNLDRNDISYTSEFEQLAMNPSILYLNLNRNAFDQSVVPFLVNDLKKSNLIIEMQEGNALTFEGKRQIARKYGTSASVKISTTGQSVLKCNHTETKQFFSTLPIRCTTS